MEAKISNFCEGIQANIIEKDEIDLIYHDKDLEGRVLCDVIAELELIGLFTDPGLKNVLDTRWTGEN